jgi:hypothetical protein
MNKLVYEPAGDTNLSEILEGYLYGLGEVCHTLFGPGGEAAMYKAIGNYFLEYLENKMDITFTETDPWERYVHIVRTFTRYGFYSSVEMERVSENKYWMLETGQYAGDVWEEQKAWERGTPPCPLWSVILRSLEEIGYTIVLDQVTYNREARGYESLFHFERIDQTENGVIEVARKAIRSNLLPICAHCKKIRDDDGNWEDIDEYFRGHFEASFTHSICPDCAKTLYPEFILEERP